MTQICLLNYFLYDKFSMTSFLYDKFFFMKNAQDSLLNFLMWNNTFAQKYNY